MLYAVAIGLGVFIIKELIVSYIDRRIDEELSDLTD